MLLARLLASKGVELDLVDLNRPTFSSMTYTEALVAMDELDASVPGGPPWCLSGSSMGGYLAARWAELHPDRVERLVLLCPGFQPTTRWPHILGEEAFARWEREGSLMVPDASGTERPLHWKFVEDARTHPPWPEVSCPTLILHGERDDLVPIEGSRRYAEERPDRVRLVALDDDHYLMSSLDRVGEEILAFYGLD
jgi:alpha-beta hydrolase superfamily lysophospholipase